MSATTEQAGQQGTGTLEQIVQVHRIYIEASAQRV